MLLFVSVLRDALLYSPADETAVARKHQALAKSVAYPMHISIPAIGVSAAIQSVGVTASRSMAVPTNFTDVGWYAYGATPGHIGTVVIDGHVNNGLAFPAVFSKLHALQQGDSIAITMSDGAIIRYRMTTSKDYDKNEPNTRSVFENTDASLLRLITCTGSWSPTLHTHDKRLVVTAVQESQ